MRFNISHAALLLIALVGCEKSLDIPGPLFQKRVVLTGLMQPDSAISVQLTYSAPTNTTVAYEAVTRASVRLLDNGQQAGALQEKAAGRYQSALRPKPGHTYRVVADVPGYGQVMAEDRMPDNPRSVLTIDTTARGNPNNNPDFTLAWQTDQAATAYWLAVYVGKAEFDFSLCTTTSFNCVLTFIQNRQNIVLTNSAYLDRFNGTYDSFSGRYYFSFARTDPATTLGKRVDLHFTAYNQLADSKLRAKGEVDYIDLLAAGPNYDRYLKTAFQSVRNQVSSSNDALNNPFAEVTPIYSNVNGGLGIFGAINLQRYTY